LKNVKEQTLVTINLITLFPLHYLMSTASLSSLLKAFIKYHTKQKYTSQTTERVECLSNKNTNC